MLGRLLRKLAIVLSVLLALALVVLSNRGRQRGFIASTTTRGNSFDARSEGGRFSFTSMTAWTPDEPLRFGRTPAPPLTAPPAAGGTPNSIVRLSGETITFSPSPRRWWSPPMYSTGSAFPNVSPALQAMLGPAAGAAYPLKQTSSPPRILSALTNALRGRPATVPSMPTTTFTLPGTLTVLGTGTVSVVGAPAPTTRSFGVVARPSSSGTFTLVPGSAAPTMSLSLSGAVVSFVFVMPAYRRVSVPDWLAVTIALLPVWWMLAAARLRRWRRNRRMRAGLCVACGYDLRGNVSGACPECGAGATMRATSMPAASDAGRGAAGAGLP